MAPRRRLIFVVTSLAIGGPQKALIGLLQRLDPDRFDLQVLVLDPRKDALRAAVPEHVEVKSASWQLRAAMLPRDRFLRSILQLAWALGPVRGAALLLAVLRGLVGRTSGVVLRQRVWSHAAPAIPAVPGSFDAAFGILGLSTYVVVDKVSATHRYHWIRSDARMLGRDQDLDAEFYRRLTGCLSVSKECADIFEEMYPHMAGKVSVYKNDIPNLGRGSEVGDELARSSDGGRLVTIARLDPLKGLELAVAACAELVGRGFLVTWRVLGDGPERPKLERLIAEHGIADHFVLEGMVLDTEPYMQWCDLLVHPSRAEGRSNAVEEARSLGRPVVATNYPTVGSQVSHGQTGLVCDFTSSALADAVESLLTDDALRDRMGRAAREAYVDERMDAPAFFATLADDLP